ncbi:MAG: TIGR04076 family protein [Desulfomonile tiedjei]|uniref:TIGR04076 family protein n=1 Tax=Desulfomonile tiedjei TaxID=2358 RepID=A0A9D6UZP3_9BACT|nr:TIGR04076 family protein [Desulfomonile tiedjei]
MGQEEKIGHRVVGTITGVKGSCNVGHKLGDRLELSGRSSGGLCGFFYHQAFPYIIMLQFGGGFPPEWGGPDVVVLDCIDRANAVTMELRRMND